MIAAIHLLLLLVLANGAPLIARQLFGDRWQQPIDRGRLFVDGKPWLGSSKTWRGLIAALVVTGPAAAALGYAPATGLLIALGAMLGDLASSFTKRRLGLPPSSMAPGLDQIPESLLPALLVADEFGLDMPSTVGVVLGFILAELILSRVLFALNIRKRPW